MVKAGMGTSPMVHSLRGGLSRPARPTRPYTHLPEAVYEELTLSRKMLMVKLSTEAQKGTLLLVNSTQQSLESWL